MESTITNTTFLVNNMLRPKSNYVLPVIWVKIDTFNLRFSVSHDRKTAMTRMVLNDCLKIENHATEPRQRKNCISYDLDSIKTKKEKVNIYM